MSILFSYLFKYLGNFDTFERYVDGFDITIYLDSITICDRFRDAGQCSKAGEKVSKTIWQSSILWPRAGRVAQW